MWRGDRDNMCAESFIETGICLGCGWRGGEYRGISKSEQGRIPGVFYFNAHNPRFSVAIITGRVTHS